MLLSRGLGGRTETAFEVRPAARGRGLGRTLARSARHLAGEPVWAQVAPANVPSLRVLLAAGYLPIGAEALLLDNPPAPSIDAGGDAPPYAIALA